MTKLYSQLAHIYHEMYQQIFDYKKEFDYYNKILSKYSCSSVLEIGCGTSYLAKYLIEAGYDYHGVDLHEEMLLAREGGIQEVKDLAHLQLRGSSCHGLHGELALLQARQRQARIQEPEV